MNEINISKTDELVMKLLYYFITKQGYNPVILHGAKEEIWLENLESEYRIIRIVTNYIHNQDQLNYDLRKTKQILKGIKKKTLSLQMNSLSIFLNLGEEVSLTEDDEKVKCVNIKNMKDLNKNQLLHMNFEDMEKELDIKEKGLELFTKITSSIEKTNDEKMKKANDVFKMKKPIVTYAIIGINILLFLMMYVFGNGSEDADTLLKFGANYRLFVKNGDLYRLITSSFLHIGVFHLLINMYSLNIIGPILESYYGKLKFLIIYLGSAIVGSLMSILFHEGISAGASGALFGLLGALLYFGYHYRIYLGNSLKTQIVPILLLNLSLGFLLQGIDMGAHIGGLISGVLISYAVGVKYKSEKSDKINGLILSLIFVGFLVYMVFFK